VLLDGLAGGMARKGFATVDQLRGMLAVAPGADERAGYVNALRRANSNTHGPS
jgi:dihydroorotate dehydrogenase (fumarate)